MRRRWSIQRAPAWNRIGLPVLIAAAVFSTSRLLFWDRQVADWIGYVIVHVLVTATIWSILHVIFSPSVSRRETAFPGHRPPGNPAIGWLTMVLLVIVTTLVIGFEWFAGGHAIFK